MTSPNATAIDFDLDNPGVTSREQISRGTNVEARTTPFYGFSLAGGYTYVDPVTRESGSRLRTRPDQPGKSLPPVQ